MHRARLRYAWQYVDARTLQCSNTYTAILLARVTCVYSAAMLYLSSRVNSYVIGSSFVSICNFEERFNSTRRNSHYCLITWHYCLLCNDIVNCEE